MSDTAFTKRTGFRSRLGVAVTTLAITGTLLAALVAPAASAGVPRTARVAAMAASPAQESAQSQLYATMRQLWGQHMEWTYETIVAFATNPSALTPTLDRLLQNQTDIGNAVAQYYGQAAGNQLSTLLHAHINGYVPVLQDAKAGNTAALNTDFAKVLANGQQIGAFLGSANPNWSAADMSNMMTVHNQETLTYAGDILQGNWPQYITDY
ncbi:MAG: hypothetical protein JST73_06425, partial [Actinobacteria bacterium]|nr:hypothetical protein [Actinomycetota bacterium]